MFDAKRHGFVLALPLGPLLMLSACGGTSQSSPSAEPVVRSDGSIADAPNGIPFPSKYKNWPVLSASHNADKQSISIVVGNLEAVRAARSGQVNPWPDGAVIGHLVFEERAQSSGDALETGRFLRAEFMFKDVEAYASNDSGWGWARWDGDDLSPHGREGFEAECIECHTKASGNDWLFSKPLLVP